jgi:hypothetical protein
MKTDIDERLEYKDEIQNLKENITEGMKKRVIRSSQQEGAP